MPIEFIDMDDLKETITERVIENVDYSDVSIDFNDKNLVVNYDVKIIINSIELR